MTEKPQSFLHEHVTPSPSKDILFKYAYDAGSFVSSHWHNSVEIIYILSGEMEVQIEGKSRLYTADTIALINSRLIHATKSTAGNEMLLIQIPYPLLKKYIPDIGSLQFSLDCFDPAPSVQKKLSSMKQILRTMHALNNQHPDGEHLKFHSLLFELLYLLYQNFRQEHPAADYQKHAKNLQRLEPVLEYTNQHYQKQISIAEISAIISFQQEYFCRFFKKNMGITYLQYLNEVRLSHIYNDLLSTDYSLSYLLELHGFLNYKVFRRMFYEKFGSTAGGLRKEKKADFLSQRN